MFKLLVFKVLLKVKIFLLSNVLVLFLIILGVIMLFKFESFFNLLFSINELLLILFINNLIVLLLIWMLYLLVKDLVSENKLDLDIFLVLIIFILCLLFLKINLV